MSCYAPSATPASPTRVLATLLIAVLTLAACGGRGSAATNTEASSEPSLLPAINDNVTLTIWGWEGTGHGELIEQYERDNPNVDVELVLAEFTEHHAALTDAVGGRDVPDIAMIELDHIAGFVAEAENFQDLNAYGAAEIAGDFLDWRWNQAVAADGSVIGLPTDVGGLGMAYRRDLFEEAGLPSDPDDVSALWPTWADFIEVGEQYVEATRQPFMDSSGTTFQGMLGQKEVRYSDSSGEYQIDRSSNLGQAFETSAQAVENGLDAGLYQFSPEWNEGMATGSFAVMAAPSWMRGYIASKAPETAGDWGLATVPGVAGNWGGSHFTIPAGAENTREAWKLISYLTAPDQQLEIFRTHGNFPSTPELFERAELHELADPFFGGQQVGQLYIESLLNVPVSPNAPLQGAVQINVRTALQNLANGLHADGDAAWISFTETTEKLLSES